MARNAEKAMTTLARWRAAQVQESGVQRERRPYLASECNDLPQAEKWRLQIVREIAKKVAQIQNDADHRYDEIFTKMNVNELRIRVPKSTKWEREGKYDKIQEFCSCENDTGEQIQFELPKDLCNVDRTHNTYTSNLKYTYKGCDRTCESNKDRKIVNVTPSNCPAPVAIEKFLHPNKDVFILKIGKKLETKDKKTDLEIELATPKAPNCYPIANEAISPNINNISQQCSSTVVENKKRKTKEKKDKKNRVKSIKGKSIKSKKCKK